MEEKLNEKIAFLQELYQNAPKGVLISDQDGLIIWVNKAIKISLKENIIGLNGPELLRQNNDVKILWPPNTKKINRCYFNGELMEMTNHKIPNSEYYLSTFHVLDGKNGIKTIMEQKLAETMANTVHDLKTPINGIYGFIQLIIGELRDVKCDELEEVISNIKSYADIILESSNSMITRIHNMLMLSRLEQGLSELNITEINILKFTETLTERFSVRLKKANIQLSRKATNLNYIIHADRDLLERALENMILNAMEALKDTDSILEKEIILYLGKDPKGMISFTVTNPGEMSKENIKKMFKSNFTTKKGNGIGAKTIRLVAEAHNGKPSIKCENGLVHIGISFPDAKV